MKRLIAVAAALALALALAGCGQQGEPSSSSTKASSASTSSSSASSSSQTVDTVKWTETGSADEAAKGAGFDKFGVFDKMKVDDLDFESPKFAYAGGVAQATYEQPASMLVVRKADGNHTAPLSDRDKTEFAQTWTKDYEGLDVSEYGAAKGAATVISWTDGTRSYAVTYQGLGGDEMSMDSDEVAAIVKAIKEADAKEDANKNDQQQPSESTSSSTDNSTDISNTPLSGQDPEGLVVQNGLGEYVNAWPVQRADGSWYWNIITRGADGNEYTAYIEADGTVSYNGYDGPQQGSDVMSPLNGQDPEVLVSQNGLGDLVGATQVQRDDGSWYWNVTVRGADGNEYTAWIEADGTVSYNGYDGPQQGSDDE